MVRYVSDSLKVVRPGAALVSTLALGQLKALFGSEARVAVLAALADSRGAAVTGSEVARRQGLTVPEAAKQLQLLEQIGLLRSERRGRLRLYSVDEAFPLWPELRTLMVKSVGAAGVLREALVGLPIEVAFIFGSVAAGEETLASDIDLMVIGGVTRKRLSVALAARERDLGREVNSVVHSSSEFARGLAEGRPFLTSVMRGPKLFVVGDENALQRLAA